MSIVTLQQRMVLGYGKHNLVSVIIPSRNRFETLVESIVSVYETADDPSRVEVLVRFDADDENSVSRISELPFDKIDIRVIVGQRLRGYIDLNKYINECCSIGRGDFLFLFNDDSKIVTKGWDTELKKFSGQTVVLNPDTFDDAQIYNTFPIISRNIYDLVGHFSLQAHNDTWVSEVGKMVGIEKHIAIEIFHDRPENDKFTGNEERVLDDITWRERCETFPISRKEFDQPLFQKLRQEDAVNIYRHLLEK